MFNKIRKYFLLKKEYEKIPKYINLTFKQFRICNEAIERNLKGECSKEETESILNKFGLTLNTPAPKKQNKKNKKD